MILAGGCVTDAGIVDKLLVSCTGEANGGIIFVTAVACSVNTGATSTISSVEIGISIAAS